VCAAAAAASGAREAAFRNVKTISECLADELMNAAKGSSNRCGSYTGGGGVCGVGVHGLEGCVCDPFAADCSSSLCVRRGADAQDARESE
jgi:hypothetical protein